MGLERLAFCPEAQLRCRVAYEKEPGEHDRQPHALKIARTA